MAPSMDSSSYALRALGLTGDAAVRQGSPPSLQMRYKATSTAAAWLAATTQGAQHGDEQPRVAAAMTVEPHNPGTLASQASVTWRLPLDEEGDHQPVSAGAAAGEAGSLAEEVCEPQPSPELGVSVKAEDDGTASSTLATTSPKPSSLTKQGNRLRGARARAVVAYQQSDQQPSPTAGVKRPHSQGRSLLSTHTTSQASRRGHATGATSPSSRAASPIPAGKWGNASGASNRGGNILGSSFSGAYNGFGAWATGTSAEMPQPLTAGSSRAGSVVGTPTGGVGTKTSPQLRHLRSLRRQLRVGGGGGSKRTRVANTITMAELLEVGLDVAEYWKLKNSYLPNHISLKQKERKLMGTVKRNNLADEAGSQLAAAGSADGDVRRMHIPLSKLLGMGTRLKPEWTASDFNRVSREMKAADSRDVSAGAACMGVAISRI